MNSSSNDDERNDPPLKCFECGLLNEPGGAFCDCGASLTGEVSSAAGVRLRAQSEFDALYEQGRPRTWPYFVLGTIFCLVRVLEQISFEELSTPFGQGAAVGGFVGALIGPVVVAALYGWEKRARLRQAFAQGGGDTEKQNGEITRLRLSRARVYFWCAFAFWFLQYLNATAAYTNGEGTAPAFGLSGAAFVTCILMVFMDEVDPLVHLARVYFGVFGLLWAGLSIVVLSMIPFAFLGSVETIGPVIIIGALGLGFGLLAGCYLYTRRALNHLIKEGRPTSATARIVAVVTLVLWSLVSVYSVYSLEILAQGDRGFITSFFRGMAQAQDESTVVYWAYVRMEATQEAGAELIAVSETVGVAPKHALAADARAVFNSTFEPGDDGFLSVVYFSCSGGCTVYASGAVVRIDNEYEIEITAQNEVPLEGYEAMHVEAETPEGIAAEIVVALRENGYGPARVICDSRSPDNC